MNTFSSNPKRKNSLLFLSRLLESIGSEIATDIHCGWYDDEEKPLPLVRQAIEDKITSRYFTSLAESISVWNEQMDIIE